VARVVIFLIVVALIAGMVGCAPAVKYNLTVSSTDGGEVTAPGEGTFTCYERRAVILMAAPRTGYRFVNWTGDVSTVADVNTAQTTITICGNYSIMANFEKSVAGGCFIATAAYGTPMAEEIQVLRRFRDECLLTNSLGTALVDLYYKVSPPIAEFITEHPSLKPIVRAGLAPAVAMSAVAVKATPADKMAIVGLLVLVSVAVAAWAMRRRCRGAEYTRG
jgi:hypothetical protein